MSGYRQVVMDRMDEQIETLISMHRRAEWPGLPFSLSTKNLLGLNKMKEGIRGVDANFNILLISSY